MPVSTYSKPTGNNYLFFFWCKVSFFISFLVVIVIETVYNLNFRVSRDHRGHSTQLFHLTNEKIEAPK